MFNKPTLQVVGVAPGATATLRIPAEQATLVGLKFALAGTTFDNTKINRIRVKIGPRVIWDLTGPQLAAINAYKNGAQDPAYLLIDFTERDQAVFPVKEIGGIDLMGVLPVGEVFVELFIDNSAVAPTITAIGYYEQAQNGNQIVLKYMPYAYTQAAAGKFTLPLQARGAMMKRLFNFYTGTNFTSATNGNVSRMECKKNGLVFFDQYCRDVRFDQRQFKKVPQNNVFVADFIVDNNHDAHIATMRKLQDGSMVYDSFEFNSYLTDPTGTTSNLILEVLDPVTNL